MTEDEFRERWTRACAKGQLLGTLRAFGQPPITCVVGDLSQTGALITTRLSPPSANRFRLFVPSRRLSVTCEVQYRTGRWLGVRFLDVLAKGAAQCQATLSGAVAGRLASGEAS